MKLKGGGRETIETPSQATKPADFALWERCDKMVLSWLLNAVEPDLAEGVVYADTARDIWKDFEDRFFQGNAPRIYQIQKAIAFHTKVRCLYPIIIQNLKAIGMN